MVFTANGVSFKMILVEGGTFTMGATSEQENPNDNEKPAHQVTLSSYYMGETEVTQELWSAVTGHTPWSGCRWNMGAQYPAYCISWDDVQEFITKLNVQTNRAFRMPTEAEWEFAARGGIKSKGYQYSGSNAIGGVGWYTNNSDQNVHPVKMKSSNEIGLYDMSGNVWELCSDWYGSYSSNAQTNPTGPANGTYRIIRGGDWGLSAWYSRVAGRQYGLPSTRGDLVGFRLALSSL